MRSFALLLLLVNIVLLLWQLTLLPWLPWQPTDFKKMSLDSPAPTKLPSLVMVNELPPAQKPHKDSFLTNEGNRPLKNEHSEQNIKTDHPLEPNQEVKKIPPKELVSDMKKIAQDEPPRLPQTVKKEEPMLPLPQKPMTPPQENQSKEEMIVKKEISLPKSKPLESKFICFQIGPYSTMTEADKTVHGLKQQKITMVTTQTRKTQVISGTWVYLPPFNSQKASSKAAQYLTQRGVKHYQIITSGALNNAISLGVYRQQENVDQLLKTLKSIGYTNPQTEKRYKDETTYWLDVKILVELTSLLKSIEKKLGFSPPIPVNCQ